jgi:hypothetical protein
MESIETYKEDGRNIAGIGIGEEARETLPFRKGKNIGDTLPEGRCT